MTRFVDKASNRRPLKLNQDSNQILAKCRHTFKEKFVRDSRMAAWF